MAKRGYTETKYPIVLVHGLAGFTNLFGVISYFHTIPWNLERDGAKVYVASVAAFNSSEQRAISLAKQIVPWAAENGGKVHLIGHSQGAPTSRIAASLRPDLVASVTSVSGVNKGSKVADLLAGDLKVHFLVDWALRAVSGGVTGIVSRILDSFGKETDSMAALKTLTTKGSIELNRKYPWGVNSSSYCAKSTEMQKVHGYDIRYYSWTGKFSSTNYYDPLDWLLKLTGMIYGEENSDGLVGVCSTYLGEVIGTDYHMNHADTINHLFGIKGNADPVSLYRQHANRLKNKGL